MDNEERVLVGVYARDERNPVGLSTHHLSNASYLCAGKQVSGRASYMVQRGQSTGLEGEKLGGHPQHHMPSPETSNTSLLATRVSEDCSENSHV